MIKIKTKYISTNIDASDFYMKELFEDKSKEASFDSLVKSYDGISPNIRNFIKKQNFDSNKNSYFILSAMGSLEYWGANSRGDAFKKAELLNSYKSFIGGNFFVEHDNKDVRKSRGKILFSDYNNKMERIELLVEIDKEKGREQLEVFKKNGKFDVSMGTKIKYDVCSICGNKARTRLDNCSHINNELNKIYEDGRKVYMENVGCDFFEISFVAKGADETAKSLEKIASLKEKKAEKTKAIESNLDNNILTNDKEFQKLIIKAGQVKPKKNEKNASVLNWIRQGNIPQAYKVFTGSY